MRTAILAILLFVVPTGPALAQAPIPWVSTYQAGLKIARERGKVIVLDFWADWCAPCHRMDAETFIDRDVMAAAQNFIFVRVDADHDRGTVSRYRVGPIPTIVFIDPWETVLGRNEGFIPAKLMTELLRVLPEDVAPLAAPNEILRVNPGDYDALVSIGKFYDRTKVRRAAYEFYEKASTSPKASSDRLAMDAAHIGMAVSLVNSGDPRKGQQIIASRLKSCDPSNEPYLTFWLGTSLLYQKKEKEARDVYERLIARFPDTESAKHAQENLQKLAGSRE